ncbi:MAG TPA: RnfABCDGE type electron transport complex subunit B [Burkholderiales bacterium]|nr:RnfABCDGE type electron transport complex subunit B [Burkholderiales bacterium]
MNPQLTEAIDALLPQTQCTKCGYQGCLPYAQAIVGGEADINQCPPGGAAGIRKLARLLDRGEKPLNPANGVETPRTAALIDETRCIGCMLCINACPTDAIVGAAKRMHTVLTQYCTGCDLCLPPCPVDCIEMVELEGLAAAGNVHAASLAQQTTEELAHVARERYGFHQVRLARQSADRAERLAGKASAKLQELDRLPAGQHDVERKKAAVNAALERARARRTAQPKAKT